jgi:hypothetical protein
MALPSTKKKRGYVSESNTIPCSLRYIYLRIYF